VRVSRANGPRHHDVVPRRTRSVAVLITKGVPRLKSRKLLQLLEIAELVNFRTSRQLARVTKSGNERMTIFGNCGERRSDMQCWHRRQH
ncbi:MAG: hypothetical protein ABJB21_03990, partial [bacterium]